jgi:glycosyltransferase involved in cell wall biosynthesis
MVTLMTLNVLSITFDANLAQPQDGKQYSGAQQRQRDYAQKVDNYIIMTPRNTPKTPSTVPLSANARVYPTTSTAKRHFIREAYQLGIHLAQQHQINCLTAANPQATGLVGYLLKRRLNIPLNVHLMADIVDNPYYLQERRRHPIYNLFTKWLLKRADSIRVSTQWELDRLAAYPQMPDIWNVPFYIDTAQFLNELDASWQANSPNDTFDHHVLTVSRIAEQKDPFTLLSAAQKVIDSFPRVRFVWVGNGRLFTTIQEKVKRAGLENQIQLLGAVPYNQVPALYKAADIFTISSFYEGTCMVLQEAALSELPIVATAFAGANDMIVDGKTGFKVPIANSQQLANRLCHLLQSAELRKTMGEAAKARSLLLYKKADILEQVRQMWAATAEKRPFPS